MQSISEFNKTLILSKVMKGHKPIRKAVFPVAGLGTRFLPATKVVPKEMIPIAGKPLIQHAYEEAKEAGIEEFIFVTGRNKEAIEEHFDYQPELMNTLETRGKHDMLKQVASSQMPEGSLFLTRQAKPLGLGHAVWCARKLINNEPFAVILVDDVINCKQGCMSQLVEAYEETGGNVVAVMNVPEKDTKKYGIVDTDDDPDKNLISVKGLVEKPLPEDAPSTLSIIGRYILQPEILDYLEVFETGAGGEIQLTDSMARLIGKQAFHALRFKGNRYDCGSRLGFLEANIALSLSDPDIKDDVEKIIDHFYKQIQ